MRTTAAGNTQEKTINRIRSFIPLEMNRSELRWLRTQLESEAREVRLAAEEVHGRKSFFISNYPAIKNSAVKKLEFFLQGELKNIHTETYEYHCVRYEINAGGVLRKVLGSDNVNNPCYGETKLSKKSTAKDAQKFLRLFKNKLDELFATVPHFAEPKLPKHDSGYDDIDVLSGQDKPLIDFDHYKNVLESKIPMWSMRLTFENGMSYTAVYENDYIPEAQIILDAIDEYYESGEFIALEHEKPWLGIEAEFEP